MPHLYLHEYDYSLWIDGSYDIVGNINELVDNYSYNNPIICLNHPTRDCIYDEALACIELGKDFASIINKQINKYRTLHYPEHNSLIASGVLYRKHNDKKLIKVMNQWWSEIEKYSCRDQLSFNYICWKNNFNYDRCDLSCFENQYFIWRPHSKSHVVVSQLFWYTHDFCEEDSLSIKTSIINDNFYVKFYTLTCKNIYFSNKLRFDPAREPICIELQCKYKKFDGSYKDLYISYANFNFKEDNTMFFNHDDPKIIFDCNDINFCDVNYIEFYGKIKKL